MKTEMISILICIALYPFMIIVLLTFLLFTLIFNV